MDEQVEDIVGKYKRLLALARGSLEANQKTLGEKDAQIAVMKNTIDKLEREKALNIVNGSSMRLQEDPSLAPRNISRRVDVGGVIWILIQYDNHMDSWSCFPSEQDLDDWLQRIPGATLSKPHKSYTPSESAQLEAEAKIQIDRVVEEFRRFKVKSEIARKQSTEETRHRVASPIKAAESGVESEVDKYRDESSRLQAQLATVENKWKLAYEKVIRENETLRHSGGEAMLAAQWRERFEATSKEKYELQEKLKIYDKGGGLGGKTLEEAYNELKDSHRELQRRMNAIERRRVDLASSAEEAVGPSSLDNSKLEYVKRMMFQYLTCREEEVKAHMETAMESIFRFNEKERKAIEERRRLASQDTLSSITSFLGGGSPSR